VRESREPGEFRNQIAVSIVSELLTVHNGRDPAHHREREAAIHEHSGAEQA
jgi:xanthine/CO dehydrogenase XdhC/CoxF family maturation factor